jgi:hypothetical protein
MKRQSEKISTKQLNKILKTKMSPINQKFIHSIFIEIGINANFVNFVSRDYEVQVKNPSFKYLRSYFRNFDEKLLEIKDFRIPIITEFNQKFNIKLFQNIERDQAFMKCDHSDQCTHTIFNLISFLAEPEPNLELGNHIFQNKINFQMKKSKKKLIILFK